MQGQQSRRGRRTRWAVVAATALVLGATSIPSGSAGAAGGGGGGAAATVGNGITTTVLNAVGMTPTALANALVGSGVSVSNVTYSGAPAQAGLLHVVDPAVVSFNDGIILSTGNVADVVGPNKSDGITGDMAGPADADLNALIANTQTVDPVTYDAASLEFDFVPTADHVYFTYTFASDEYLEWVNLFNDVFAFYVNGQNCATTPTGDPVSIDTINSNVNPSLFRDNSYSSPPPNPINIESDGLSVELICSAPVIAGQTNHMKLAIADTSDQILDSVVMIKANSLSTQPPESCNDGVDNDDDHQVDMEDPDCQASTTPPPVGSTGIGSANTSPPFTGNEGSPITMDASALEWVPSTDTVRTSWTVTGINGTTGTCTVSPAGQLPLNPDGSVAVVTATCPDDGEYVARVDGWDAEGGNSWDTDVDFFVHNAPPDVAIDSPATGDEVTAGQAVTVSAGVHDPGASDTVSCSISWGDGTSEPGDLTDGTCTGTHTYADPGSAVISVTASDDAGASAAAASVVTVVPGALPTVVPGSASIQEGDSGSSSLEVPVTLSAPSSQTVTASWTTMHVTGAPAGQATPGTDYTVASGTATFAPGQTTTTVSVPVNGDTVREGDEYVVIGFTSATHARIGGFWGLGFGGILNDDPVPTVVPGSASAAEGDTGTTVIQVPVDLTNPTDRTITVPWATRQVAGAPAGQATAGTDYQAASGTVTFSPGQTHATVAITVAGDLTVEPDEYVVVSFGTPTNAKLGGFWGLGFAGILNDDA